MISQPKISYLNNTKIKKLSKLTSCKQIFAFQPLERSFLFLCSCGYLGSARLYRLTASIILRRHRAVTAKTHRFRFHLGSRFLFPSIAVSKRKRNEPKRKKKPAASRHFASQRIYLLLLK